MKKWIAFNKKGQKQFCMYEVAESGIMIIDFHLPRHKFGIRWSRDQFIWIVGIREHKRHKNIDIVRYMVHPSLWLGKDFKSPSYYTTRDCIDKVFDEYIKLYDV